MIIRVKYYNKPIKLHETLSVPRVGDILNLPPKVRVIQVITDPLGIQVNVSDM